MTNRPSDEHKYVETKISPQKLLFLGIVNQLKLIWVLNLDSLQWIDDVEEMLFYKMRSSHYNDSNWIHISFGFLEFLTSAHKWTWVVKVVQVWIVIERTARTHLTTIRIESSGWIRLTVVECRSTKIGQNSRNASTHEIWWHNNNHNDHSIAHTGTHHTPHAEDGIAEWWFAIGVQHSLVRFEAIKCLLNLDLLFFSHFKFNFPLSTHEILILNEITVADTHSHDTQPQSCTHKMKLVWFVQYAMAMRIDHDAQRYHTLRLRRWR